MILKEVPMCERPREKVKERGVESLTNVELLAILLRTGSKELNVLELAQRILYVIEDITELNDLTIEELMKEKGVGEAKAITIVAAVEIGKRLSQISTKNINFTSPQEVFSYFKPKVNHLKVENLYVVYLDIRGNLIKVKLLTTGTINQTFIDPLEVFKWAYKYSSTMMILVHNHPSGDPTPSMADLKITHELVKKAKLMNMEILDHIIIGITYYSMRQNQNKYKIF